MDPGAESIDAGQVRTPLAIGTPIGSYEVVAAIGAGGMGEVYRARDTRLNRDVALKLLPEMFASDPERLARFEREAQVLASLNHPYIAAIHGIEENNGVRALVLEFVVARRWRIPSRVVAPRALDVELTHSIAEEAATAGKSITQRSAEVPRI